MKLTDYIFKESQKIDAGKAKKIATLSLYKVLQQPYFNGQYKFLEIVNRKGYKLFHPKLTHVPGAINKNLSNGLYQYYTNKQNNTEWVQDINLELDNKKYPSFVHPDKNKIFKEYKKILEQAENMQDIIEPLLQLIVSTPHALSILSNTKFSNRYNHKNIFNFIEQLLPAKEIQEKYKIYFEVLKKQSNEDDNWIGFKNPFFKQESDYSINKTNFFIFEQHLFSRDSEHSSQKVLKKSSPKDKTLDIIKILLELNTEKETIKNANFLKSLKNNENEEDIREVKSVDILNIFYHNNFRNEIKIEDVEHLSLNELLLDAQKQENYKKTPLHHFNISQNKIDFWLNAYNSFYFNEEKTNSIQYIQDNIKPKNTLELIDNTPEKKQINSIVEKAIEYFNLNTHLDIKLQTEHFDFTKDTPLQYSFGFKNNKKVQEMLEKHSFSDLLIEPNHHIKPLLTNLEQTENNTAANFPGFLMSLKTNNEVVSNIFFIDEAAKKSNKSPPECQGFKGYIFQYLSTRQYHRNKDYGYDLFCQATEQSIQENKSIILTMSIERSAEQIHKIMLRAQQKYKNEIKIFNIDRIINKDKGLYSLEHIQKEPDLYDLKSNYDLKDLLKTYIFYKTQTYFDKNFITLTSNNDFRNNKEITVKQEAILYEQTKEKYLTFIQDSSYIQQIVSEYKTVENFMEKLNTNKELKKETEQRLSLNSQERNFMDQQKPFLNTYYQTIIAEDNLKNIEQNIDYDNLKNKNQSRRLL